jgi:hypothetical protein
VESASRKQKEKKLSPQKRLAYSCGGSIFQHMKIKFSTPFTDEAVIGTDPEMADMGNPNGHIYGRKLLVEAVTADGRRFLYGREFASFEAAHKFALRVEAFGAINRDLWNETFPVYGSQAWEVEDAERRLNLEAAVRAGDAEGIERYS